MRNLLWAAHITVMKRSTFEAVALGIESKRQTGQKRTSVGAGVGRARTAAPSRRDAESSPSSRRHQVTIGPWQAPVVPRGPMDTPSFAPVVAKTRDVYSHSAENQAS
jgi:hypothetical protein